MSDDPSIYDYTDFRAYLRDWFRARDGRPSQSGFARRVPCSAALLSSVINGTRNLGRARAEPRPQAPDRGVFTWNFLRNAF